MAGMHWNQFPKPSEIATLPRLAETVSAIRSEEVSALTAPLQHRHAGKRRVRVVAALHLGARLRRDEPAVKVRVEEAAVVAGGGGEAGAEQRPLRDMCLL